MTANYAIMGLSNEGLELVLYEHDSLRTVVSTLNKWRRNPPHAEGTVLTMWFADRTEPVEDEEFVPDALDLDCYRYHHTGGR